MGDIVSQIADSIGKLESGGSYTARSKTSSASGKHQYLRSTWAGYGGYATAADAPPAVQEQRFRQDTARALARYKDPALVAVAHFQGGGVADKIAANPALWDKKDANGLTTRQYVSRFNNLLGRGGPSSDIPTQTPYGTPMTTRVASLDFNALFNQGQKAAAGLPQVHPADYQALVAQYAAQREKALMGTMNQLDSQVAKAIQNIRANGGQAVSDVNAQGALAVPDFKAIQGSYASGAAGAPTDYTAGYGVDNSYYAARGQEAGALTNAQQGAGGALLDQTASGVQSLIGTLSGAIGGPGGAIDAGVASVQAAKARAVLSAQLSSDKMFQDYLGSSSVEAQRQDLQSQIANQGNIADMVRNATSVGVANQNTAQSDARAQDSMAQAILGLNAQMASQGQQQAFTVGRDNAQNAFTTQRDAAQNTFTAQQNATQAEAQGAQRNQSALQALFAAGVPMNVLPDGTLVMPNGPKYGPDTDPHDTRYGPSLQAGTPIVNPAADIKQETSQAKLNNIILEGKRKEAALKAKSGETSIITAMPKADRMRWESAKTDFSQQWKKYVAAGSPAYAKQDPSKTSPKDFDMALVSLGDLRAHGATTLDTQTWLATWFTKNKNSLPGFPKKATQLAQLKWLDKKTSEASAKVELYGGEGYPDGSGTKSVVAPAELQAVLQSIYEDAHK